MEEIDIKDFLKYLKKFILQAIIIAVLAVGATIYYDTQIKTPVYKANATVVLAQSTNENTSQTTLNDITVNQKLVTTYSEIVKSKLILQQVIDELSLNTDVDTLNKHVTVTAVEDTEILKITVEDADPKEAAKISNKIAEVFSKEIVNIYKLNNVSTLDHAQEPENVSNNTTIRDAIIAGLIAVFGVVAISFIIYYFDDSIKYSEDLENKIGLPITGKIVKSDINKKTPADEIVVEQYPKAIVSESIKGLRTNLQFSNVDGGFKTVLITSANASEGKSFVAANLATSFAQANKKVLLIDCDLRKGRLHKIFNIANLNGYSNLLTDEIENYKKYIKKTHVKNLSVIPRGDFPPNPSELLASNKNRDLIFMLKTKYDIIIFDGAPCNGVTDSAIMSTLVDETLIVVRDGVTKKATLNTANDNLKKVNAHVAGVVLNGVNRKTARYYYYYGK
ncbi:polysaccharide biosynthesis tyrosine autokinase [Candidatus Saccharibacteria bacterium]|nr:polysaccharide biosynthesis tyrosine autokinase [Candidatus Saccharibacteria bacterium]